MRYIVMMLVSATLLFGSIGKITAINGKAYVERANSKIKLFKGSDIEENDVVKTMQDTKLQIVFDDQTVISLGQKTVFKVDKYIFSPTKVQADFSVTKGIFKSITGQIGQIDHSKFKLKTKNATIGVRGTTFIGVIEKDKETIACTSGEIVVQNTQGYVSVKKGEMTSYRSHQAPKTPKVYKKSFIKKVKDVKPSINSENIVIPVVSAPATTYTVKKEIFVKKETQEQVTFIGQEQEPSQEGDMSQDEETSNSAQSQSDATQEQETSETQSQSDVAQNHETQEHETSSKTKDAKDDYGKDWTSDMASKKDKKEDEVVNKIKDNKSDLELLREKVGGASLLRYEGQVAGRYITDEDNKIVMDIDLGSGQVDGNIKFTQKMMGMSRTWDTDIKGSFKSGSRFELETDSDGYSGNGYTKLKGEHLEEAHGMMHLKHQYQKVDIDFTAQKKSAK